MVERGIKTKPLIAKLHLKERRVAVEEGTDSRE